MLNRSATHSIRADLITAYSIQFGQYTGNKCRFFERNSYTATRSHNYKVMVPFVRSDVRKSSYAMRPAKAWTELPADVVDFSRTKNFTNSFLKIDLSKYCASF
jgi:hypothetical protein